MPDIQPNNNPLVPNKNLGLDNNNLDLNKGLEQESDKWLGQDSFSKPINLNIPNAPSSSPREKKSSILDDIKGLASDIDSSNGKKNPGDNQLVSKGDLPKDYDKYSTYYPGLDNEELYGQKQSGLEKAAYAVPRILGTASKTILQGITAPLVGLGYMAAGGNFIKNDYNDWLESYDKWTDKNLPLYTTAAERNSSFLGQVKYGNAWVHLGEFIGMGVGMAGTAWLTGGAAEVGLGALDIAQGSRITANYLNAIDKWAESTSIISKLENSEEVGAGLISKANEIWTKAIPESEKLDELTSTFEDINKTYGNRIASLGANKGRVYGAASMLGMNAGMASQANTQFAQSLVQEIKDKEGREPSEEELAKIKDMADSVGQWTFGLGTVMSTFSFHGLLKGMIGKDAEKALFDETNKIVEKDAVEGATQYGEKKLPFATSKDDGAAFRVAKNIGNKGYQVGKLATKLVDPWAGIGLTEFSLMGPSVENYYKKKYDTGKADLIEDALGPNVNKIFTKDGMSTLFMGMLGAGPLELVGKNKESKERALNTKTAIDKFNTITAKGFLNNNMDSIIRGKALKEEETKATAEGDEFTKYNTREQQLINYLYPRVKFGMKGIVSKELDGYRAQLKTPDGIEQLKKEFNIDAEPTEVVKQLTTYLDHMESMANKMESNYKAVSLRYGRQPGFTDTHIEKLLYLTQMTDNSTERIKKLTEELQGDKRLQDTYLNTSSNKDNGGYIDYNPTKDIVRLLSAESRDTIVRNDEGEKKIKAHELYNAIHTKIDGLLLDDTQKDILKQKVNDLVKLNGTRKEYLKQYHDITNNPSKYSDDRKVSIVNPYAGEYGDDTNYALNNVFNPKVDEIPTKTGEKSIDLGEEYYAGSPITVNKGDGTSTGFRKFTVIKEIKEGEDAGKLLIKTEKGEKIAVDKDFLKKHDIEKSKEMSSQAKFYDRNKLKRIVRKVKDVKKENTKKTIEAKQSSLEEERTWAIDSSAEAHNDEWKAKKEELDSITKQVKNLQHAFDSGNSQRGMGHEMQDLLNNKKVVEEQLQDVIKKGQAERERIHTYYNNEQKRLEQISAELDRDPKEYLDNKAKASYAVAKDKIDQEYKDALQAKKDQAERGIYTDMDFEKAKLEEKREKKIQELKDQYRDLYNKKLKELESQNFEAGTLEYSPTEDKLYFSSHDGDKKSEITREDLKKEDVFKMDKTSWTDEDKNFFNNYESEISNKEAQEILKQKSDNIEKALQNSDKNSYTAPESSNYIENDSEKEAAQTTANKAIAEATGKPASIKGAKKPINVLVRSSSVLDYKFLTNKYPALKPWLESRNKWAERSNNFMSKILEPLKTNFWKTSDLKDKNGNYKQPTVLFVHAGNQDKLGLKGFISSEDKTKSKTEPIYMVMVHTDENNKKWTIDNSGKKLKEIGSDHSEADYSSMIYTARPSDLKWEDGQKAYQDVKNPEDEKKYSEQFNNETKEILESTGDAPIEHVFKVSNGFLTKPEGGKKRKTALSETGLIDDNNLEYPTVQITTLGGRGIFVGDKEITVPAGIPYWVRGTAVEVLDAKKFTEKNKNLIFQSLKWISETLLLPDVSIGKQDPNAERKNKLSKVQEYLASVAFFNHSFQKEKDTKDSPMQLDAEGFPKNRYDNQISIGKNRKDGLMYLMLGKEEKVLFTPSSIEANKEKIQTFLDKVHHITLSKELKKAENKGNTTYYEITGFDEKGNPIDRKWDSYTKYLTSKKDPSGKERDENEVPLTINTDKAVDGNTPLHGMYITTGKTGEKKEVLPKAKLEKQVEQEKKNVEIPSTKETSSVEEKTLSTGKPGIGDIHYTTKIEDGKVRVVVSSFNGVTLDELSKDALATIGQPYDADAEASWKKVAKMFEEQLESKEQKDYDATKSIEEPKTQPQRENVSNIDPRVTELESQKRLIPSFDKNTTPKEQEKILDEIKKQHTEIDKKIAELKPIESSKVEDPEKNMNEDGLIDDPSQEYWDNQNTPEPDDYIPSEVEEKANKAAESAIASLEEADDEDYMPESKERKPIVRDMITSEVAKGTPLENIPAFTKWLKEVLPQVDVKDLPHNLQKLAYTWGQYSNNLKTIFLSPDAIEGVGFHEAFHAVFDGFLSPKEQKSIFKEFRSKEGTYVDRFGNTRTYAKASDLQIMEQLADNFREHNLTNKVYDREPVKMNFFTRLKNFFSNFFGLKANNIQTVFDRINAGYYKTASFYNREEPTRNMVRFGDGTKVTQQTVRDFSNGVVQNIYKYLGIEDGGLSAITEGRINVGSLLDNIKEDINDKLKEATFKPKKFKRENPDVTIEHLKDFFRIMANVSDEKFDEKTGKTYLELNDKKWNYLLENKIKDKITSLGLKTVKAPEDINDLQETNEGEENPNSSIAEGANEEASKESNKNIWGADNFKLNAKDTAPKEIQFLFNTIAQAINDSVPGFNKDLEDPKLKTNSLLFNKIVEDNSLFYQTMHAVSYSGTLEEMDSKMKEIAMKVPSLVPTYKYIFGTEADKRTPEQWTFLSRFFKTFSKYAPEPIMHRSDEAGNHFVTAANADSVVTSISRNWESNFKGNSKVSSYDATTKTYKINPKASFTEPTDVKSRFKFLEEIGFTGIKQEKYESYITNNPNADLEGSFSKMVKTIYDGVIKTQKSGHPVLGKDIFGTGKSINKLAEITAELTIDKYSSQFQRLDKEFVQTNINQNFYARLIGSVRNALSLDDFLNKNERLKNDAYTKNSLLLKADSQLFDKEGNPKQVSLIIDNGKVDENNNRTLLTDMTGPQRVLYTLNGLLRGRSAGKGIFQMAAPADQSSDFGMEIEHYIPVATYKSEGIKQFQNIFKGYLEDEIRLIGDAENRMKYEELAKKVGDSPRAMQLRYFKDILSPELVKTITDYANSKETIPFDEFFKTISDKFNFDLKAHLGTEVSEHLAYLQKEGLTSIEERNGISYYKLNGLNTDFLSEFGVTRRSFKDLPDEYLFTESELKNILQFANMNYKIHNTELSKLFYGDPANYKDFLKRAKMFNSGTELNFHSEEFNIHLNKEYNKAKVSKKEVALKEGDYGYRKFTNNFSGMTIDHGDTDKKTTVVSRSIDFIRKVLKNDPDSIKKYEDTNNPIDAQSYGTIDAMREFKLKAGTWSNKHEELFQFNKASESLRLEERLKDKENSPKLAELLGRDRIYSDDAHGKELKALHEKIVEDLGKKIKENALDYRGLLNVEKYLGAGFVDNDNFNTPNGLKTSTLNLFSNAGIENTPLEDMYFFMQKHGVDYIGPKSQQKFGRINKAERLYKIDKSYDTVGKLAISDLTPEQVKEQTYQQPFSNYNKIVETAGSHDEGTIGTQLRVQSTVDMMNSGLPRDWYNGKDEFATKQEEWNNKTEEEKRKDSDLYRIHSEMNDCLKGMIKQGEPIVYDKLGLKDGELKHPEKLLEYLKSMTDLYNLPANLRDAIRITTDENGKEVINLDQLPNRQSLEYIVNSLIEKHIIRPKMNGGPKIMVSGEMWEKNGRQATYFDKSKNKWITLDSEKKFNDAKANGENIILTSNELSFYNEGEDGKMKGMEIKVNNHFKDKMFKWAKKNGKDLISDEELLNYLNSNEGKELLEGIGFRIPSQGLNSFDVFRITGFTDPSLGDIIVVPSEVTTKAGSDFDVDKLNTYLKNFYLDENGMPKKVKFFENTNSEEELEKIWEQNKALTNKNVEDLSKEEILALVGKDSNIDQTEKELKKDIDKAKEILKSTEKELKDINTFIKENLGKDPYEVNATEAIHNKYFDLLGESILHDSNAEKLLTPNSTDYLEEVDKVMAKIEGTSEEGRGKGDIDYSNFLNMLWVNQRRQEVLEAKNATSISASGVTSHAMMQNFPYHLNPMVNIKLPHDKITVNYKGEKVQATSLANIVNRVGQNISEVLSQIVNTTVDAVNNPILMRLLPSIDVFSQSLFLIRTGVDPMHTFFFLKQPIIQEYIKEKKRNENRPEDGKGSNKKLKGNNAIRERIFDLPQFKGGNEATIDKFELTNSEGTGLQDMLGAFSKGEKLSDARKAVQREILKEFMIYNDLSTELFEQQNGSYWGNVKKATDNNTFLKNRVYEKAEKNPNFIGLHDNMKNSWFGTLKDSVTKLSDVVSSALFKMTAPIAEKQTRAAREYIVDLVMKGGNDEKNNLLNKVKSNFMDFLVHNFAKDSTGKTLNEEISRLLLGKESLANRLLDIKEKISKMDENSDIAQNPALKKLTALISNPKNPRMIGLENKPSGVNESEDFTSGLDELKDHPEFKVFYEDLVKLNLLQSGTGGNRNSISSLIPHQDFENYTAQAIQAIDDKNGLIHAYDRLKIFWRTNFNDDRIVPKRFETEKYTLDSGEKAIHLPVATKAGKPYKHSPVVKIKRPIDITVEENGKKVTRHATPTELAAMRNNNEDFKENLWQVEGYQQVTHPDGTPVIVKVPMQNGKVTERFLYKPINLWGDGKNMGEFYTEARPSVLDKNFKVNEMSNEEYIDMYNKDQKGYAIKGNELDEVNPDDVVTEDETPSIVDNEEELTHDIGNGQPVKPLEPGDLPTDCPF